jgi:hypothetical protein
MRFLAPGRLRGVQSGIPIDYFWLDMEEAFELNIGWFMVTIALDMGSG